MKVLRSAVVLLLLASCSSGYWVTSKSQMRDTLAPIPTMTLGQLEGRENVPDGEGNRICSDLLLRQRSIERFTDGKKVFTIGVIELSDDGHVKDDVQEHKVLDELDNVAAAKGAIVITFVHGWHHRPKVCDNNLACFRQVIQALSVSADRPVFGVYLGWRGDSWKRPTLVSFWDRKSTAHDIGHDGGREVLLLLQEHYRRLNDRLHAANAGSVTMVTVGHSFGGALVYSAVEAALVRESKNLDRYKATPHIVGEGAESGKARPIRAGIGDLVVLLNPAFEARRYRHFAEDLDLGPYRSDQMPVLFTVASEGDEAVKAVFPIGRSLYFLFHPWSFRGTADVIGAGHYDPQTTHDLLLTDSKGTPIAHATHAAPINRTPAEKNDEAVKRCHLDLTEGDLKTCQCEFAVPKNLKSVLGALDPQLISRGAGIVPLSDEPGARIELRVRPDRVAKWDPHTPFIVARASADIVPAHSDIYTPRFVTFLAGYIHEFLALQEPKQEQALINP